MNTYSLPLQIRWSDIDANKHLRHSVYYDFGAYCRISLFTEIGITLEKLTAISIGPVILREEAIFRREIIFGDSISITTELAKATADFARWSFRHVITKQDGTLATTMNIDGAWIDTVKRKLAIPPVGLHAYFEKIPRAVDFEMVAPVRKTA
jgi:acyl-CoA thioester hydrolase